MAKGGTRPSTIFGMTRPWIRSRKHNGFIHQRAQQVLFRVVYRNVTCK